MEFKAGDIVYSIQDGVSLLEVTTHHPWVNTYPISTGTHHYTSEGRYHKNDLTRSLFTLAEAEQLGLPGAREPIVFEAEVIWNKRSEGSGVYPTGACGEEIIWDDLVGKEGTLTFVEDPK